MRLASKRFRKIAEKVDSKKKYDLDEGVKLLKGFGTTKFDQTVNLALMMNIDAKKSEQGLRGSVALPNGIGKVRKVVVFADGPEAEIAKELGVKDIGMDDLAKKITDGWTDFDVAIAVQRAMKVASKLGKVLGPMGKMPNPKNGTVIKDNSLEEMRTMVKEFMAGRVEFRNDADGNLHVPVGKMSFSEAAIKENVLAFVDHIKGMRPAQVKGYFIKSATLSAAMSPGVTLTIAPC